MHFDSETRETGVYNNTDRVHFNIKQYTPVFFYHSYSVEKNWNS